MVTDVASPRELPPLGDARGRLPWHVEAVFACDDPDVACLLVGSSPPELVLVEVATARELRRGRYMGLVRRPAGFACDDPRLVMRESGGRLTWLDPSSATVAASAGIVGVDRGAFAALDARRVVGCADGVVTTLQHEGVALRGPAPVSPGREPARGVAVDRRRRCVYHAYQAGRDVTVHRTALDGGRARSARLERRWITSLALSGDGARLWAIGEDSATCLDAATLEEVGRWELARCEEAVAMSADGGTLFLYAARSESLRAVGEPARPGAARRGLLVNVSRDGARGFWVRHRVLVRVDFERGPSAPPVDGHLGAVTALAYAPGAASLATAADDGEVRVWALASRSTSALFEAPSEQGGHVRAPDGPRALAFSPDGGALLAACARDSDGTCLRVWDVPRVIERAAERDGHTWRALEVSPDGAWAAPASGTWASYGAPASFTWLDLRRDALRSIPRDRFTPPRPPEPADGGAWREGPRTFDAFNGGRWCARFADGGRALRVLFEVKRAREPWRDDPPGHALRLATVDLGAASVVELRECPSTPRLTLHAACLSAGARYLASRSGDVLTVWDVESMTELWRRRVDTFHGPDRHVDALAFGGEVLAFPSHFRAVSAVRVGRWEEHRLGATPVDVCSLALAPDDRELAAGLDDGRVMRWSLDGV